MDLVARIYCRKARIFAILLIIIKRSVNMVINRVLCVQVLPLYVDDIDISHAFIFQRLR